MTVQALLGHTLVLAATLCGIVGMGTVFDAAMQGNIPHLAQGVVLLALGLWWAGRELGRSIYASRARHNPAKR